MQCKDLRDEKGAFTWDSWYWNGSLYKELIRLTEVVQELSLTLRVLDSEMSDPDIEEDQRLPNELLMSLPAALCIYVPAPEVGYVIDCLTLGKINKKTRRLQDINLKSRRSFRNLKLIQICNTFPL